MVFFLPFLFFSSICFGYDSNYPDSKLTPGKVTTATKEDICRVGYTKDNRHVTKKTKKEVFARYGFIEGQYKSSDYEVDHFISLELGGSNEIENLWIQPFKGEWNARQKDVIETHFHREICKGSMTVQDAQERIRKDWIAEYKIWKEARDKRKGTKVSKPKPQ